jgi:hypothetical protein
MSRFMRYEISKSIEEHCGWRRVSRRPVAWIGVSPRLNRLVMDPFICFWPRLVPSGGFVHLSEVDSEILGWGKVKIRIGQWEVRIVVCAAVCRNGLLVFPNTRVVKGDG